MVVKYDVGPRGGVGGDLLLHPESGHFDCVHKAEVQGVLWGQNGPQSRHHLRVQRLDLDPLDALRLIDKLHPNHHILRRCIVLVRDNELRQSTHAIFPARQVRLVPKLLAIRVAVHAAREGLVRRLGPGKAMQVQHGLHAPLLQPRERAPQIELAAISKPILLLPVQQPVAKGNADVGDAEGGNLIHIRFCHEGVPVRVHEGHRVGVRVAALALNQAVLVRRIGVPEVRRLDPILHHKPAAEVHAHERRPRMWQEEQNEQRQRVEGRASGPAWHARKEKRQDWKKKRHSERRKRYTDHSVPEWPPVLSSPPATQKWGCGLSTALGGAL